jgi:pilus assembly protein Flp/PilA
MKQLIARFIKEEEGQDLIEYGLLAALIAVVAYVLISNIGTGVNLIYNKVNTQVGSAAT